MESETKKSPTFWDADLARKSWAFGNDAEKRQKKPSLLKKSPTFWEADFVRKSRAFRNFAKEKANFLESEAKKARLFGKQI